MSKKKNLPAVPTKTWVDFCVERGGEEICLQNLVSYVGKGGLVTKLCEAHGLDYAEVMAAVRAKGYVEKLDAAKEDRKSYQQDMATSVWMEILANDPNIPPTHTDRLKAAEALSKHSGGLKDSTQNAPVFNIFTSGQVVISGHPTST